MKKIALMLALLMVAGMAPAWCLVESVDNYVIIIRKTVVFGLYRTPDIFTEP